MAGVSPKWSHNMAHAVALDQRMWPREDIRVDRRGRRSSKVVYVTSRLKA
jgi:hypothetical protein